MKSKATNFLRNADKTVSIAIALGALLCVVERVIDVLVFHQGSLFHAYDWHTASHHLLVLITMAVFGLYARLTITTCKRMEEALRESEEKYRHLFENLNDAAFLADIETGVILETNLAGEALLGRSRDEIVGMHQPELHPPDKADEYRQRFAAHVEKGRSADYEGEIIRKDGTVVPVAISASPLTVGGQRVILGLFHDITRRRRVGAKAEARAKELAASEEKYRSLLGNINDGYCVIQDEKVVLANEKYVEITGIPFDQVIGYPLGASLPEEAQEQLRERFRRRISGEAEAERYELTMATGVIVEVNAKLIDYEGRPAVAAVVRDITERKLAEAEAEARAKELAASEEKYRRLLGDINDGYCVIQDEKIVLANEKYAEIVGIPYDQLIGQPLGAYLPPEAQQQQRERFRRRIASEAEAERYELTTATGRAVEVNVKLIDYEGRPAVSSVMRDITERKRMEEALRESEEKYRRLLGDINDGYLVIQDEKIVFANEKVAEILGVPLDEYIGSPLGAFLPPDGQQHIRERFRRRIAGEAEPEHYELTTATGRAVEVNAKLINYEGRPAVSSVMRDITERKLAEVTLRDSERRYRLLAENVSDVIWTVDRNRRFTYMSPSVKRLSGHSVEEALALTIEETLTPASLQALGKAIAETLAMGDVRKMVEYWSRPVESELYCKDGSTVWAETKIALLPGADGRPVGILGVTRDITERRQMEEIIKHMAYHDALTGLPNRVLLNDRLNVEIARARRNGQKLALLFLDLDRFKKINDTFGHKAGDQTLQAVGQRLTSLLRKSDTVARMGGDEFMLILPEIAQVEGAAMVAQKTLEALREPFILDGREVRIAASIGIAIYPDDGYDVDTLMRSADSAMYGAKEQGGDRYLHYTPDKNADVNRSDYLKPLPIGGIQDEG